ncbi:Abi family protein [Frigoribacterium sp. CFBP 8766]|nr:Abi family protein [Frigoribacterium sp. CFBP 8766]
MRLKFKQGEALDKAISSDRLQTYLNEAHNDVRLARALYVWDRDLAAAVFADIAVIEVALRNAIHRELSNEYGPRWYDTGGLPLDDRETSTLRRTWDELPGHVKQHPGSPDVPGRLVARFMFGFWRNLFDAGAYLGKAPRKVRVNYDDNWRDALHKVFPGGKAEARRQGVQYTRDWALKQVSIVHALRNRVGHHEPLVRGLPLPGQGQPRLTASQCHEACLRLARMLDRDLAEWLQRNSSVRSLLEARPAHVRRPVGRLRLRIGRLPRA